MARRGFTLIEVCTVCGLVAVLASLAWPAFSNQWQRAGRAEAIEALTRLQMAQEQHREMFGRYGAELAPFGLGPTTAGGRYEVALTLTGAESYRAQAQARAGGPQRGDHRCPALTLEVVQGFASSGPDGHCWNR